MAYFECIIGGAGTTLTVTCDSVFAGKTITCTDGTTTLTAVCPSASPYVVEFDLETDGTWTISGTISGTTHSTSITIETSATLHEIPNGNTITPVANIQTWLHCANIWDKTYTTISQVLADTSTLLALISSNNAVDYMARSTNWASSVCANQTAMGYIGNNDYCANKLLANSTWRNAICNSTYFESVLNVKVPTMTSNTTPSGEAFAVSEGVFNGVTYGAYRAFNGQSGNGNWWHSGQSGYGGTDTWPKWIGYKFTNPTCVRYVMIQNPNDGDTRGNCGNYTLQGSHTGNSNDWVDIETKTRTKNVSGGITYDDFSGSDSYEYFRINIAQPASGSDVFCRIMNLQFYGRA